MHDAGDMELLREYDRQGSEAAFAALVQRHVGLVYSAALRHVGIAAHAEEITQAVFVILARKATCLRPDTILESWLYETTRLTALSFRRGERRRQFREQEAYMQSTLQESADASTWHQLAPLLDEAMARLGKKDRDAVLLRFFKDKNLREVAAALKVSETAAQRRVHRAVEKLRAFFTKRGIILPAAVLTAAISANSVQAAPVALAKMVTSVAIAKGAAASASTLTLIKGALKIMAWTKTQSAIVAGAVILLTAGTTTVVVNEIHPFISRHASWTDDPKYWQLDFNNQNATLKRISNLPPVLVLRPTRFPTGYGFMGTGSKVVGKNQPTSEIIRMAYDSSWSHRIVLPEDFSQKFFDIMMTLPDQEHPYEKLQQELARQCGLTAHFETNDVDVLFLKQLNAGPSGLVPSNGGTPSVSLDLKKGELVIINWRLSDFANQFDNILGIPVFDETGIQGNYTCTLTWKQRPGESMNGAFKRAVSEQLGLAFASGRKTIPMLVVEKAK